MIPIVRHLHPAKILSLLPTLVLLVSQSSVVAQSTWTGANNTLWNNSLNWSPNGVPASGANIIVDRSVNTTIALDVSPNVSNWTSNISANATTVTASGANRTLSISGTLTKTGTGSLSFRDNGSLTLGMTVGNLDFSTANSGVISFGSFGNEMTNLNITTATVSSSSGANQLVFLSKPSTANITVGTLNMGSGGAVVIANGGTGTNQYSLNVGSLNGAGGVLRGANGSNQTYTANLNLTGTSNGNYLGQILDAGGVTVRVTKSGSATQTLGNVGNSYSGGTLITGGALVASVNNSLGASSGTVEIGGANAARLVINSGISIANNVTFSNTNASSSLELVLVNGEGYRKGTTGNFTSSFVGGTPDTAMTFLGGNTTAVRTLNMGFAATSTATNDNLRRSDVFDLAGSGTDRFVLQLSTTGLSSTDFLGWLDGSNMWVTAVSGNTASGTLAGFYASSFASFVASNGGSFNATTMLGAYGNDGAGNVWAVIDHSGDFAVVAVPEPSTWFLLTLGLVAIVVFHRARVSRASVAR